MRAQINKYNIFKLHCLSWEVLYFLIGVEDTHVVVVSIDTVDVTPNIYYEFSIDTVKIYLEL